MFLRNTGLTIVLSVAFFIIPSTLVAQQAANDDETSIVIKKGASTPQKDFEIIDEKADVAGDSLALDNEAKDSWRKACDEWKNETRQLNKDNQIIALNCGTPKPQRDQDGVTTYKSQASFKVKVKVRS